MEPSSLNGFGSETYWNRPTSRTRSNRPSRSLSPSNRASNTRSNSIVRNLNPTISLSTATVPPSSTSSTTNDDVKVQAQQAQPSTYLQRSPGVSLTSRADMSQRIHMQDRQEELDEKDDKALVKLMKSTLPQFSNEHDWEMAAFELILVLDRVWPHKEALDITKYLKATYPHFNRDMERRADSLIYFALTLSAKKDSFAKIQIMAASHPTAIPCVLQNEGRKLYQMFQSLFTMTSLHTSNLPSLRKQFYDITQNETETVLAYTSRVDIIVATMAKLGERLSSGAWIHALGNGLRAEFTNTKDGILYSKAEYDTVLSVKSKMASEEAILKDKRVSAKKALISQKDTEDEIAMTVAALTPKVIPALDQAQIHKGKGGKNGMKGQREWTPADQWTTWQQPPSWTSPVYENSWTYPSSKGKGKAPQKNTLWCDIHQAYGHSTDWCFNNPNKSGGPPKQPWGSPKTPEWCDNHQVYGHSTAECRKGKSSPLNGGKGGKGKSKSPNRAWKSENFPANYDQATPVLPAEQKQPSNKQTSWWDLEEEISSIIIDTTDANLATFEDIEPIDATIEINDDLDEATASLLDLHFLAIIQQQERQQ